MKATSIETRKERINYTICRNLTSAKIEKKVYVLFENGSQIKLHSICSEIGNEFGFSEADKIKKSTSEKTIINFINKYESFVSKYI